MSTIIGKKTVLPPLGTSFVPFSYSKILLQHLPFSPILQQFTFYWNILMNIQTKCYFSFKTHTHQKGTKQKLTYRPIYLNFFFRNFSQQLFILTISTVLNYFLLNQFTPITSLKLLLSKPPIIFMLLNSVVSSHSSF